MKFKSVLVSEEVQLGNGRIKPGKVILIPLDDAAKASPFYDEAVASGAYVPATPNEKKEAQARLDAAEKKELKRQGRLPADA